MISIPRNIEQWIKTLLAGAIGGGANAGLAALGVQAGAAMGEHVAKLEMHQVGHIVLSGAVVGALMFLAKSPVPPNPGDTQIFTKPPA